jgi:hypothetical protein
MALMLPYLPRTSKLFALTETVPGCIMPGDWSQPVRYAFVCMTIFVIWVSVVLMALITRHSATPFLYYSALIMTVGLFWIGFRTK